ncbi:hypothetical protein HYALB_00007674 [Hymenoscyphus albidus]|uniref:STEEP1 domain-containing protein n=1 Tax=Hymenoscyphus albidus TaxID=595503 RepID=A0A9N9LER4_9HELO|nr:hypothetical protein HYALB_00007674 [Hymenoscyphus albidus]
MTIQPPKIQTYHCICTTLLLSTTHTLSALPRRTADSSIILPLPSSPPTQSQSASSPNPSPNTSPSKDLPSSGYTILLSLTPESKPTLIRREDGFEKRNLYRCSRCRVVVGYGIANAEGGMEDTMEVDGEQGGGEGGEYEGKVIYILNGGVQSTEVMMKGRKIREEDVEIGKNGVGVFE